jgi:spore maturation protein B
MIQTVITVLSAWLIPLFILLAIVYAHFKGVHVFDTFVEGAREGFSTAVGLIPYLVAMLVAISLFRQSGAMDLMASLLMPVLGRFDIPPEILPLAVMRPVSGSSALAIMTEILQTRGPDSYLGRLASTMQGSTDTTLFVITVYFGSVGIRKARHALPVGLMADLAGFVAALAVCKLVFG